MKFFIDLYMPINKRALERYRVIDEALTNRQKKYPSKTELIKVIREKLGLDIHPRTLEEDFNEMRNNETLNYFAPIEYNKREDGYYYTDPNYSIYKIPISKEDLKHLKFAAKIFSKFKNIPYLNEIQQPIEQLERLIEIGKVSGTWTNNSIVQLEYPDNSPSLNYFRDLVNLINNKQACNIRYHAFNKKESNPFKIHPYLIKEYKNRWYLVALNVGYNDIRVYGLERITSLETIDQFHSDEFIADDYFKHAFGITVQNNLKPVKVVLQFNEHHAPYIISSPIHPTQKIIKQTKKSLSISIEVHPSSEFTMFLLSHGSGLKIKQPKWLREEIQEEAKNTLELYK